MLTILLLIRSAPIVYTTEGEQVAKRLWRETMEELSFAGVQDIVDAFGIS